jgi:PrcB C-terminal
MKRALLSLLVLLLISIPGPQVLRATQENQGRQVPITPMGPRLPGPRTSFTTGCYVWDQLRVVIRDRDAWLDLWKRIHRPDPYRVPYPEPPPLPEIDFSREMIVVAAMGRRPTSNYDIIIDGAYERDNRLEVVVRSVENRKGCGAYMIITAPVDIVRLPKTERTVVFREIEVVPDCQ